MATKRSAPHIHPSRQGQVPNEPHRKRQKPNNAGPKSFRKAHPVNELKNQVRSLKRLLERNDDLPATVRVEKERALQSAQHELGETQKAKKRSEMISRYHKIRFFDRQKATKRLKRARKELKAQGSESSPAAGLRRAVHDAEVDVNYAQYFPLDEAYVSLFPTRKSEADVDDDDDDDEANGGDGSVVRKGDQEIWERVKQCTKDGTLEALRNGKLTQERAEESEPPKMSVVSKKQKVRKDDVGAVNWRAKAGHDMVKDSTAKPSDDESDGGFFE